jgi:hypothetical protein
MYIPWGSRLVPPFRDWAFSKYVIAVGAVALPSALFITFFFWFLGFFTRKKLVRWLSTALLATGTVFFAYSTVFYSHALVAAGLFTAFALLFLLARGVVRLWAAPAVGLLLGLSLLTEYTVVLIIAAIGLYAIWQLRRNRRSLGWVAGAACVPVAGLLAYNFACFGNPFDTGYSHDFCWSSAQAAGYAGFTYPHLGPLWDLTFGTYRGLFFGAPFLLLALPGAYFMLQRRLGLEAALCIGCSALFIVAISAYWGWNGGAVDGPRYLVPIVPFLALPAAIFFDRAAERLPLLAGGIVLGAYSVVVTWLLFLGGELFPISWLRNPLTDYSLPQLAGNHIAPNAGFFLGLSGWTSLLPLAALVTLIAVGRWPHPALKHVLSAGPLAS